MWIFLIHGLLVSTWISRIPTFQINLNLSNAVLGLTLLGTAAGSVLAIPICGRLVDRYTSKQVVVWSTLALCVSLPLLSFARDATSLAALLFIFGASAGTMDVAMNAQGVEVEKAMGRPILSRLHSMFSFGAMIGSAAGGLATQQRTPALVHFALAATLFTSFALFRFQNMLTVRHPAVTKANSRNAGSKIPATLLALSAIAFCMLVAEGAMADWTDVYLHQVLHTSPGFAASGYAVFSAAMALFRFFGDAITARLGNRKTVQTGSFIGAAGLTWALLAPSAEWALPGFAATGAGFSVIVPIVFGAGGRLDDVSPGVGIAAVTGFGYVGFLIGPPAIGFTSEYLSLRYALAALIGLILICAVLSSSVRDAPASQPTSS
ncbi:MAG: MFS transporter [Bryobacteraceae bacterium]